MLPVLCTPASLRCFRIAFAFAFALLDASSLQQYLSCTTTRPTRPPKRNHGGSQHLVSDGGPATAPLEAITGIDVSVTALMRGHKALEMGLFSSLSR